MKKKDILKTISVNKMQKVFKAPKELIKEYIIIFYNLKQGNKEQVLLLFLYLGYLQVNNLLDEKELLKQFYKKDLSYITTLLKNTTEIENFRKSNLFTNN